MTRELIRKGVGEEYQTGLPKGHWRKSGEYNVVVACPKCGFTAPLDHEIEENGDVNPSVVCSQDFCDWHVHIRLEGYETKSMTTGTAGKGLV